MGSTFTNFPNLKLDAAFTIGAEAANVINVAAQIKDRLNGGVIGERASVGFYLADDANGDTPSASAPDGGIAIGTDGAMREFVANLSGRLTSESNGAIDIDLTHAAGAATWYLILEMPDGSLVPSGAITFA